MKVAQAIVLILFASASLWLMSAEGFVSAALFFVFGIVLVGLFGFVLELGGAVGGFIDRFIRRHGRPDR